MPGSLNLIHELFMKWFLKFRNHDSFRPNGYQKGVGSLFFYDLILMTHYDLINFREQFII